MHMTSLDAEHKHGNTVALILTIVEDYKTLLQQQKADQDGIDETDAKGAVDAIEKELVLVEDVKKILEGHDKDQLIDDAVPAMAYEDALKTNELLRYMSYDD